jgi:predicted HAD superfamily hydrolase
LYWFLPAQYRNTLLNFAYRNFSFLFKGMPHFEQWNFTRVSRNMSSEHHKMVVIDSLKEAQQLDGRIAIHLHMYYPDLAVEFYQYLKNMPFDYDLYVSVPNEEGIKVCHNVFLGLPKLGQLIIEQVPNKGRDIAPMFCNFATHLKTYDYIAHLHSKKSLYNHGATEGWREYLCANLLGSEPRIRRIIGLMQGNSPRGIVYPQNYSLLPYQANSWLANKTAGSAWCARLGITNVPQGYFDFPAGSMFWAKSAALKPLFDVGITLSDFPNETGQTDGTFAHCLERLLVLTALKEGYQAAILQDMQNKSWSAWGFQYYALRPLHYLSKQFTTPAIKLIAFDIFDTLLCRPLLNPETVKTIVAERIGGEVGLLYQQCRAFAESQARLALGKDIGLDAIFIQLGQLTGLSDLALNELRALEETVEQASLHPRAEVVMLYQHALATGKPVVLISDMFLSRTVIEASLNNNGIFSWDRLFLSSEIGLRKDTGQLYDYVFSQYGISPNEMIMVGDNERSDVQIPCDKGVIGIHVLKPIEFARGLPRIRKLIECNEGVCDLNDELTLGLFLQHNFSAVNYSKLDVNSLVDPTPFNLGYSVIGPLLIGFSHWLLERARCDSIDRLYFLSREGQLLKSVYDKWTDGLADVPQSSYLIVSRRAVSVPCIVTLDDIFTIAKTTYYPNTISHFLLERYGLQLSAVRWKKLTQQYQWTSNSTVEVAHQTIDHLVPLLTALASDIMANASTESIAIKHYLKNSGLEQSGRYAVVDVGYGGTIQDYLNSLAETPIHGYYLMTDERVGTVVKKHNVSIGGCYAENIKWDTSALLMYQRSFDLEKFLSSNNPQLICYFLDEFNILKPQYRQLSYPEMESEAIRRDLHEGISRYALDAIKIREDILPNYKPSCAIAKQIYESFIEQQSHLERDFLTKIALDDHYSGIGVIS